MNRQYYYSNQQNSYFHEENMNRHVPFNYYNNGNIGYHTNYSPRYGNYMHSWPYYERYGPSASNLGYNYPVDCHRIKDLSVFRNIGPTNVYHPSNCHSRKQIQSINRSNSTQWRKNNNIFSEANKKPSFSSVQSSNDKPTITQSVTYKNVKKSCRENNLNSTEAFENKDKTKSQIALNGKIPLVLNKSETKSTTEKLPENNSKIISQSILTSLIEGVDETPKTKKEANSSTNSGSDYPGKDVINVSKDNANMNSQPNTAVISLIEETEDATPNKKDSKHKSDLPENKSDFQIVDLTDVREKNATDTVLINLTGEIGDSAMNKIDPIQIESAIINLIDVDDDNRKITSQLKTVEINVTGEIKESVESEKFPKQIISKYDIAIKNVIADVEDSRKISQVNMVADRLIEKTEESTTTMDDDKLPNRIEQLTFTKKEARLAKSDNAFPNEDLISECQDNTNIKPQSNIKTIIRTAEIVESANNKKDTTITTFKGNFHSNKPDSLTKGQSKEENTNLLSPKHHEEITVQEYRSGVISKGFPNEYEISAEKYQCKEDLLKPFIINNEESFVRNSKPNTMTLKLTEEITVIASMEQNTEKYNDCIVQTLNNDFLNKHENTEEQRLRAQMPHFEMNLKENNQKTISVIKPLSPQSNESTTEKKEIKLTICEKDTESIKNTTGFLVKEKKSTKQSTADNQYTKNISLLRKSCEEFKKRINIFKNEIKSRQTQHNIKISSYNSQKLNISNSNQQKAVKCNNWSKEELLSLKKSSSEIYNNDLDQGTKQNQDQELISSSKIESTLISSENNATKTVEETSADERLTQSSETKISYEKSCNTQSKKRTLLSSAKNSIQDKKKIRHNDEKSSVSTKINLKSIKNEYQYHVNKTYKNYYNSKENYIYPRKRPNLSPERNENYKKKFKYDKNIRNNINQTRNSTDENKISHNYSNCTSKRPVYFNNEENKYFKYKLDSENITKRKSCIKFHKSIDCYEDEDDKSKDISDAKRRYIIKRRTIFRKTKGYCSDEENYNKSTEKNSFTKGYTKNQEREYHSDEGDKYNKHFQFSNSYKRSNMYSRRSLGYEDDQNDKEEHYNHSTSFQKYMGTKTYLSKDESGKLLSKQSSERESRSNSNSEYNYLARETFSKDAVTGNKDNIRYERKHKDTNNSELIGRNKNTVINSKNGILKDPSKQTPGDIMNKLRKHSSEETLKSCVSLPIRNESSNNNNCKKSTKRLHNGDVDKQKDSETNVKRKRHSPIKFPESVDNDFDLRSKIPRRSLNNIFTKICNKRIAGDTINREERSNLIITFENEKDGDKLSETSSKQTLDTNSVTKSPKELNHEKPKTKTETKLKSKKKRKNFKVVIKFVCESSTSSDEEEIDDNNEDVSFLDDLNVDDIIACIKDISKDFKKDDTNNINKINCDGPKIDFNISGSGDIDSMPNVEDLKVKDIIEESRCQYTVDEFNTNKPGVESRICDVLLKSLKKIHSNISKESDYDDVLLSTNIETHVNIHTEAEDTISISSQRTDYGIVNDVSALDDGKTCPFTENGATNIKNKLQDQDVISINSEPTDYETTNSINVLDENRTKQCTKVTEDKDVITITLKPSECGTTNTVFDEDETNKCIENTLTETGHDKTKAIDPEKENIEVKAPINEQTAHRTISKTQNHIKFIFTSNARDDKENNHTFTSCDDDLSQKTYALNFNSEINDIKEELTENYESIENIRAMINNNLNCEKISNNSVVNKASTDFNYCTPSNTSNSVEKDIEVSDIKQELTENTESLEKICAMIYGTSNDNFILNNIARSPGHYNDSVRIESNVTINKTLADFQAQSANISQVNITDPNLNTHTDKPYNNLITESQKENIRTSQRKRSSVLDVQDESRSLDGENQLQVTQESGTSNIKTIKVQNSANQNQDIMSLLEENMQIHLKATYKVEGLMHKGSFSNLFRCKNKGTHYVAKITSETCDSYRNGMLLQQFLPEMNCNCISVLNGFVFSNHRCFIMEYYPKNLEQVLTKTMVPFHINLIQNLSKQLVDAVLFLKNNNIVHSDIKPSHLLMNSNNDQIKLGGFDEAYNVNEPSDFLNIGTTNYRAPEVIMGHSAGFSIDVWTTALVIYEMATRSKLFVGKHDNYLLYEQMCTLGNMPQRMINNSIYKDVFFAKRTFLKKGANGIVLVHNFSNCTRLYTSLMQTNKRRINGKPLYTEQLKKFELMHEVLEKMLQIYPENRWDMNRVAKSDFFMK